MKLKDFPNKYLKLMNDYFSLSDYLSIESNSLLVLFVINKFSPILVMEMLMSL